MIFSNLSLVRQFSFSDTRNLSLTTENPKAIVWSPQNVVSSVACDVFDTLNGFSILTFGFYELKLSYVLPYEC